MATGPSDRRRLLARFVVAAGASLIVASCVLLALVVNGGKKQDRSPVASASTGSAPIVNPKPQPSASSAPAASSAGSASLDQQVGQHIIAGWRGSERAPAWLLNAIGHGHVGGVVLFAENATTQSPKRLARLVAQLQRAAQLGGQPPLLVAVDQEGGDVRRIDGPPNVAPSQFGPAWPSAFREGLKTGKLLRRSGVTLDLAPVLDTPSVPSAFIAPRAFGTDPGAVAAAGAAFIAGLQQRGVAGTAKHYPGLGSATTNTDMAPSEIHASRAQLNSERLPFDAAVATGVKAVMVSSATYAAIDPKLPAIVSPIVIGHLRRHFRGVVISDDLGSPALAAVGPDAGVLAMQAGVDLLLYTSPQAQRSYRAVRDAVIHGAVSRDKLRASTRRVLQLKKWLTTSRR